MCTSSSDIKSMLGDEAPEDVIIQPGDLGEVNLPENVHLIPAHIRLEGIENALSSKHGPFTSSHDTLRAPIASLKGKYDYIFLDSSPSMTPPTKAAYMNGGNRFAYVTASMD